MQLISIITTRTPRPVPYIDGKLSNAFANDLDKMTSHPFA